MKTLRLYLCAALCATAMSGAQAQNLLDFYRSAKAYDAPYQAALAQYQAGVAKADQAKANVLPSASVSASLARSQYRNTSPVTDRSFTERDVGVNLTQPLYRPAQWASYLQGAPQAALAQAVLVEAEQDLIVRVSQAYFEVLAAQDTLAFVRAQKAAVAEQLAAAKRNFEVGSSTITDTHEAQAKYDLVLAQEITAENDLRIKKIALQQFIGALDVQPYGLARPSALPQLHPGDMEPWVQQAAEHPRIKAAQLNLRLAQLETEKAKAGHKPTLDLEAGRTVVRNINGTTSSPLDAKTHDTTVGVSLNVPLFSGFAVQNRIKETLALEDKAQAELDKERREVIQATRNGYLNVVSGLSSVKAYEAAEVSTRSALESNKLGYQVGVRINIDVLNAQSQVFETERDLAQARYNVLVGTLKLKQANGTLNLQDVEAINALLANTPVQ